MNTTTTTTTTLTITTVTLEQEGTVVIRADDMTTPSENMETSLNFDKKKKKSKSKRAKDKQKVIDKTSATTTPICNKEGEGTSSSLKIAETLSADDGEGNYYCYDVLLNRLYAQVDRIKAKPPSASKRPALDPPIAFRFGTRTSKCSYILPLNL